MATPPFYALLVAVLIAGVLSASISKSTTAGVRELEYLDESVDPCDDFYKFTCGNFQNVHPRPGDQQLWDHFIMLQEDIHTLAKHILNLPRNLLEPFALQKAKAFYTSCMNVNAMEAPINGYHVQAEFIKKVKKWPAITADYDDGADKLTWNELAELTAEYGLSFLFSFSVQPSLFDGTINSIGIDRDALQSPEASAIRPRIPNGVDILGDTIKGKDGHTFSSYLEFLKSVAYRLRDLTAEAGTSNEHINAELKNTIKFIQQVQANGVIGNVSVPPLSPESSVKDLQTWTDGLFGTNFIDWVQYLNKVINRPDVKVTNTTRVLQTSSTMIYGLLNLYKRSAGRELKNYVIARLLTYMAPDSDRYMRQMWQEFTEMNNNVVYSRDDYCVRKTLGYSGNVDFGLAVTYQYQKYHFDHHKLKRAAQMVKDLQDAFMGVLENAEWMDEESKRKVREKAKKMVTLLGYPEEIVEDKSELNEYYGDLKVCTWDHFGNSQRLRAFQLGKSLEPIGDKKKRDLWTVSPLEVNAFYNPGNNRVLLPVSMLNNVFFGGRNNLLDYARMGSIIGHEITHGFDKNGKDFNGDGQIGSQWSAETLKAFEAREGCFKQQYSEYAIEEIDAHVNGTSTLNENLADNGGLRTAYKAYLKLKAAGTLELASDINYTPEQLFFIGFGTMWCAEESQEYTESAYGDGRYAPSRYRVIGAVSNMPEFADAFQCPAGSNMNPSRRCQLW